MTLPLDKRLVLFHWLLDLFEVKDLDTLAANIKETRFEGFDVDNVTHFHHALSARPLRYGRLSKTDLLGYDENIVRHWQHITTRRNTQGNTLYPKYFQYLALLFTEIYLDRYFRHREGLLDDLNGFVRRFNSDKADTDKVAEYTAADLNKLAFMNATGSGKTLLMHVNILQFQHYLNHHGRTAELNKIILLTPNEGLSEQHRKEFALSNIAAEFFNKNSSSHGYTRFVEIIDIHKLKETAREKTVAIEGFEGNNLVLVDEGHRGTSSESRDWLNKRNRLCADGFSFEYSATFKQAVEAAKGDALPQLYARCIAFDYSYKYFYADGNGKDYRIFNLTGEATRDETGGLDVYLTACLLAFYQQMLTFAERKDDYDAYLLAAPLWVFVGSSVNAVRSESGRQVSDVLSILLFLADFLRDSAKAAANIKDLLNGKSGLLDAESNSVFAGLLEPLAARKLAPEAIYTDAVRLIFNAPAGGALHVESIKGASGELALRVGTNDAFGVINVGDADKLRKLCDERDELATGDIAVTASLFDNINQSDSPINLLIGSKKFSEGWDSPRVSTMGLLNVGRREGSQIIQLFGRGVRLRGYANGLKRSRYVEDRLPPDGIEILETLNIFGVRADYMDNFKRYLEGEGLPPNDNRIEIVMPVLHNFGASDSPQLKMIRVRDGVDFIRDCAVSLDVAPEKLSTIGLDYYPKIEVRAGADGRGNGATVVSVKQPAELDNRHLAFLDYEKLYFDLCAYKHERGWTNFHLTKAKVKELLTIAGWYELLLPPAELNFQTVGSSVRLWQEIATALLKKYCDYYYKYRRTEYEKSFLEVRTLDLTDPNFTFFNGNDDAQGYQLSIEASQQRLIEDLKALQAVIVAGYLPQLEWQHEGLQPIFFSRHLYQPLFYLDKTAKSGVSVKPVALNESEHQFVTDLQAYCETHSEFFNDKEMYLLRNMSKGRGIGFFEAGNFHPDFILWLIQDGKQYVTFADPKGLGNLDVGNDPKIGFHKKVKEIEDGLNDKDLILNSFILSITPYKEVKQGNIRKSIEEFEADNVLFMRDRRTTYINQMFEAIVNHKT